MSHFLTDCRNERGGGVTYGAALGVVRSVGQDEGFGHQGALTLDRAEGTVPAAGQDHVEMGWNGSFVSE